MAENDNQVVPAQPPKRPLTAAERRAAQVTEAANKQADLKREAAERRDRRAGNVT
jgi:hypothetical protein